MTTQSQDQSTASIQSRIVVPNSRLAILPKYFPNTFIMLENAVYSFTEKLCDAYCGGFWQFHELSNGGFYMAPDYNRTYSVSVPFGNGFEREMSSDALGITVCLYVYCYMAEKFPAANFGDHYWHLKNFAYEHKEAASILNAID